MVFESARQGPALDEGTLLAGVLVTIAGRAEASQLIDRNATDVRLQISDGGREALLTYRARGGIQRVHARGARNARHAGRARPQVAFELRSLDARAWQSFEADPPARLARTSWDGCGAYDGPSLPGLVAACKAPDGSYWGVQTWRRLLPNRGLAPARDQGAAELRLSHWRGPVAQLRVWQDWVYGGRYHHLFGRLTYRGRPVHGFGASRTGVPLDGFGRNVYLDTLNSAYGPGWRRENGFLARRPNGAFCYGFYPFGVPGRSRAARPSGNGERYRITVIGPGVTPDIRWEADGLPDYDPTNPVHLLRELRMNALSSRIAARSAGRCRHN